MNKADIEAASKFWSTGPGKAVMERWPVEWEREGPGLAWMYLLARDAHNPWWCLYGKPERLRHDERWGPGSKQLDITAVYHIHGHYLDLLAKAFDVCRLVTLGSQGVVMGFYNLDDGEESEIAVNGSTLHEALKAAMEAAFGENP